ncbi:MAG: hypothetical protein DRO11_00070 [Methanobacteriota archaeon]|nr:MAG: hypothetical protein DRO11_00070 [Euryarchaeota archaeon]
MIRKLLVFIFMGFFGFIIGMAFRSIAVNPLAIGLEILGVLLLVTLIVLLSGVLCGLSNKFGYETVFLLLTILIAAVVFPPILGEPIFLEGEEAIPVVGGMSPAPLTRDLSVEMHLGGIAKKIDMVPGILVARSGWDSGEKRFLAGLQVWSSENIPDAETWIIDESQTITIYKTPIKKGENRYWVETTKDSYIYLYDGSTLLGADKILFGKGWGTRIIGKQTFVQGDDERPLCPTKKFPHTYVCRKKCVGKPGECKDKSKEYRCPDPDEKCCWQSGKDKCKPFDDQKPRDCVDECDYDGQPHPEVGCDWWPDLCPWGESILPCRLVCKKGEEGCLEWVKTSCTGPGPGECRYSACNNDIAESGYPYKCIKSAGQEQRLECKHKYDVEGAEGCPEYIWVPTGEPEPDPCEICPGMVCSRSFNMKYSCDYDKGLIYQCRCDQEVDKFFCWGCNWWLVPEDEAPEWIVQECKSQAGNIKDIVVEPGIITAKATGGKCVDVAVTVVLSNSYCQRVEGRIWEKESGYEKTITLRKDPNDDKKFLATLKDVCPCIGAKSHIYTISVVAYWDENLKDSDEAKFVTIYDYNSCKDWATPEICNNGLDDDMDGKVDCEDPDCVDECNISDHEDCFNDTDDDGDGYVDCDDPDCRDECSKTGECPEVPLCDEKVATKVFDENGDGLPDNLQCLNNQIFKCEQKENGCFDWVPQGEQCQLPSNIRCGNGQNCEFLECYVKDPLCRQIPGNKGENCSVVGDEDYDGCPDSVDSECGGMEKGPQCGDGVDNDCDTMVDAEDPDCFGEVPQVVTVFVTVVDNELKPVEGATVKNLITGEEGKTDEQGKYRDVFQLTMPLPGVDLTYLASYGDVSSFESTPYYEERNNYSVVITLPITLGLQLWAYILICVLAIITTIGLVAFFSTRRG